MANFLEVQDASVQLIRGYGTRTQLRPNFLRLFAIALLMICAMHLYIGKGNTASPAMSSSTNSIHFTPAAHKTSSPKATPTPTVPSSSSLSVSATVLPYHSCTPAQYAMPSQLDLSAQPVGLTQSLDTPLSYTIYGNTGTGIIQQLAKCAPHVSNINGTYAAYTSYSINWQYNYGVNMAGLCTVTAAKVGLHQNQIFPDWQGNGSDTLAAQWRSFMSGLKVHEQGQVTLNQEYAALMINQLQSFSTSSCVNITSAVDAQMNADLRALNAAHQSYENQTNYGATQGAIVP